MRKITEFPIKYPVTVTMIVLAIILLGFISFKKLGTDLFPDLNNPRIYVELKTGEKPPDEVEKKFVESMESAIMRLKGVMHVSSVTKVGASLISIEFNWEKDMDEAFLDVQKAMNDFSQNDEVESVNITRQDPNATPVLLVALQNPNLSDLEELRRTAENYIKNEVIRLEGIADMKIAGQMETEIEILTNQYILQAYGVTIDQISSKITGYNQSISGGTITDMGTQYIIKGNSLVKDIEDIKNIILYYKTDSIASGNPVKVPVFLRDVAQINVIYKKPENVVRLDGNPALGLYVYKETKFNTVQVVETLDEKLKSLIKALPGYEFTIINNQGAFIDSAISEVKESALIGILLAVFILFVFLRRIGSTFIVSIAIPISIIATFNLMYFNGLTLNIMTLGGLALGAGMLVDNAIVVLENIFRLRDSGMSVKEAAIEGTAQVGGAITASTLTTIVVFLPIVYLRGASGELFKDQAWTVAFSLISSLFVALLIIPVLFSRIYRKESTTKQKASINFPGYYKILDSIVNKRYLIGLLSIALVVGSVFMVKVIGSEYFPKAKSKNFTIDIELTEGTRLERTASTTENIEKIVKDVIGEDLELVYSHSGPSTATESGAQDFFKDENSATIFVKLKDQGFEKMDFYIQGITQTISGIVGLNYEIHREESTLQQILDNEGPPVVVEVKGEDSKILESLAEQVSEKIQNIDYLYAIETSIEDGAPEIEIKIDRYRAGIYNVDLNSVVSALNENLVGIDAGELEQDGEKKDIIIKYPDMSMTDLDKIMISSGNVKIPVSEVASIVHTNAPREIYRNDQSRIVRITAWMKEDKALDHVTSDINKYLEEIVVPLDYYISVSGEEAKRKESFGNLFFALLLSVVLVYMVLAAQFESLLHPFTILLTIPLAAVGSILLFFVLGMSLNVMAYIGIIMLAGIAVNNSIILVDAIKRYEAQGYSLKDSILNAGQQRIRPIIMTSLTTILALLPLSLGFGESSSLRAPMALAVIGGLVTSTLLTLVVIPCVYYIFEDFRLLLVGNKKTD